MRTILASLVILLGFQQGALAQQPQEPAGASAYLMGVFDTRDELTTVVQIVNPTPATLLSLIGLFDDRENLLACVGEELTPNDLFETDVQQVVPDMVGVVKVVTLDLETNRPRIGVVGNQRLSLGEQPVAETGLHPIQMAFLNEADILAIRERCGL
jgi:hypothetical protein